MNGSTLGANETLAVNGSAEAGGSLRLFAGAGGDTLIDDGGAGLLDGASAPTRCGARQRGRLSLSGGGGIGAGGP